VAGNVVALGALLAGCGGGDGSDSHAQESTPQSAPPRSTPAPAPRPGARWSYTQLVRHLAGRRLAMPHGTVRVDPSLLVCNGRGPALRRGGTRRWSRYTCTQTGFRGGVDRDITFDVVIVSPSRLAIGDQRYGPE
jgi:hypothetical protein